MQFSDSSTVMMVVVAMIVAAVVTSLFAAHGRTDDLTMPAPEAATAGGGGGSAGAACDAMPLPEGMTAEDMQAWFAAGTPGEHHQRLAQDVGEWKGKTTIWMGPNSEPLHGENRCTVTSLIEGRFIRVTMQGDMPCGGPHYAEGIYGYDNVSGQFVSAWIDNCTTGILQGKGELSHDGRTMTWNYMFNCPIRKKPTPMREVETHTGPDSKTLDVYGSDPKTGNEYRMMRIEYQRISHTPGDAK